MTLLMYSIVGTHRRPEGMNRDIGIDPVLFVCCVFGLQTKHILRRFLCDIENFK